MWIFLTFVHAFFMALVNYMDEYLTQFTSIPKNQNIHKKVGGLILVSSLFGVFSLGVLSFFISDYSMTQLGLVVSFFSAFPMVVMFGSYFYLFQKFSAHQVVPLFGLSSVWLLILELFSGDTILLIPFLGIILLLYGAYVLDSNSFTWKIPTRLLFLMIPVSSLWAFSLFLAEFVGKTDSILNFFFYQYIGIFILGIILFLCIRPYRQGFLERCRKQGKIFVGGSIINESFAQISFLASMLAVSIAPLATYVTAIGSIQYLILFFLLFLFPLHQRNKIFFPQIIAILFMILGIILIEFFR